MSHIDVLNTKGEKLEKIQVTKKITDVIIKPALVQQAVLAYLANQRQSNANTKSRGEVAGGGRKPWKQKGTGRARAGSSRSPIWIGGGITFGPTNERNYTQSLTKKMRQKAFLMAVSSKINDKKFVILKEFDIKEPKTKIIDNIMHNLPSKGSEVLLILSQSDPAVELSAANLPYIKTIHIDSINIYDIMRYKYVITDIAGFTVLQDRINQYEITKEK